MMNGQERTVRTMQFNSQPELAIRDQSPTKSVFKIEVETKLKVEFQGNLISGMKINRMKSKRLFEMENPILSTIQALSDHDRVPTTTRYTHFHIL